MDEEFLKNRAEVKAKRGAKVEIFVKAMPLISQMVGFYETATVRSEKARALLESQDVKDKAQFLYFHALENNWLF